MTGLQPDSNARVNVLFRRSAATLAGARKQVHWPVGFGINRRAHCQAVSLTYCAGQALLRCQAVGVSGLHRSDDASGIIDSLSQPDGIVEGRREDRVQISRLPILPDDSNQGVRLIDAREHDLCGVIDVRKTLESEPERREL